MNRVINTSTGLKSTAIFLLMIAAILAGCASNQMAAKQADVGVVEPGPTLITDISTSEDSGSFTVWVKGNRLLTYTSVKQPFPLGVILYLPGTSLAGISKTYTPDSDIVGPISCSELTDKWKTLRIEISLKNDAAYEVIREDTDLKISFKKPTELMALAQGMSQTDDQKPEASQDTPSDKNMPLATRLQSITTTQLENGIDISINADGKINEYKSFTITNPARIVFDLFNIQSPYKTEQTIPVDAQWVKRIRHYGYPDRLRVVLDTTEKYLSDFTAHPSENGLVIRMASMPAPTAMPVKTQMPTEMSGSETAAVHIDTSKPAWVNRIDFLSETAGKSTLVIGTTSPVKYKLKKVEDKKLLLNLYNTNIPDYRQRPLITTRFESAVDRVTPFQTPAMKATAMVAIELRESVPYTVEQLNDLLMLHFDASSVPPQTIDEAQLPPWKKVITQMLDATQGTEMQVADSGAAQPQPTGKYTGEKIALNFYETDIKNVFRILMDVSQKNFAIDKDVTGTVTLTFDKPVPWDQVLDLVLKMNQLGMVYEGDIVRIATLKSLEAEAVARQAKVAADKKYEEQKTSLEPLVTEYIPVNYANATEDILPHIVLTEGRGSVTVDARNNQIIITDVPEKIKQAKETVKRIDKVTPQVVIEARIVEATDTFSREFGTSWSITGGPLDYNWLGGDLKFDLSAANPPTSTLGQIGVQFARVAGNQISVVDARLMASESEGQVKIISSPKILTLDNTAATIKQGLSYPFNKLDADGNTTTEFKDIALELQVTPHVTPDSRISMDITIKNNEIGAVINNQISFTTKEATTKLLVNDGDTIIIGGIRKTRDDKGESGLPGLKNIPLVGWLFKTQSKTKSMEELLIFITPRIVQLEQRNLG